MSEFQEPETYDLPHVGVVSREVTQEIAKARNDQYLAHLRAWKDAQRAAGQVWTACYWRHQVQYNEEFFSLDEARAFLVDGEEAGDMSAVGVLCPDGSMDKYSFDWDRENDK